MATTGAMDIFSCGSTATNIHLANIYHHAKFHACASKCTTNSQISWTTYVILTLNTSMANTYHLMSDKHLEDIPFSFTTALSSVNVFLILINIRRAITVF